MNPVLVSVQSDPASHTFTGIFKITNTFNYSLTLNVFSADAQITHDSIPAGNIHLDSPVTIAAGQTSQITISGQWTSQIQEYMANNLPGISSIYISVTNVVIDINGITIQYAGPIEVGDIPLTMAVLS
jgi:hypothetical protein